MEGDGMAKVMRIFPAHKYPAGRVASFDEAEVLLANATEDERDRIGTCLTRIPSSRQRKRPRWPSGNGRTDTRVILVAMPYLVTIWSRHEGEWLTGIVDEWLEWVLTKGWPNDPIKRLLTRAIAEDTESARFGLATDDAVPMLIRRCLTAWKAGDPEVMTRFRQDIAEMVCDHPKVLELLAMLSADSQ